MDNVRVKERAYETVFYPICNCRSDRGSPATKAAVDAVTRCLAKELAPRKIRVMVVEDSAVIRELLCHIISAHYSCDDTVGCQSDRDLGV